MLEVDTLTESESPAKVLDRLCARAQLQGVTVQVLRHSFAAMAAEMGFSELTIAGLLGPPFQARQPAMPMFPTAL